MSTDFISNGETINVTPYDQTPPPPPEDLFAQAGDSFISLSWSDIIAEDFVINGKPELANFGYGLSKIYLEEKFKLLAETKKFNS